MHVTVRGILAEKMAVRVHAGHSMQVTFAHCSNQH